MNPRTVATFLACPIALLAACDRLPTQAPTAANVVATATAASSTLQSPTTPAAAILAIDLSTPDKALKSYWTVLDRIRDAEFDAIWSPRSENMTRRQAFNTVTTREMMDDRNRGYFKQQFERDILEVKVESPSRAVIVVHVKNATPIPPGRSLSPDEQKWREKGARYKYVLEADAVNAWRVAELWDYRDYLSPPAWNKRRPSRPDSYFPTLTHEGS